jgi:Protein of unknown function (DUF1217).
MVALLGLGSATLDYTVAVNSRTQLGKLVNNQPQVKANVDYYKANADKVESVDDLMKDRRLLSVALGAYGLESQVDSKALLRKLLSEDPTDSTSLAQRMADPRYRAFATAFASLREDGGASIGKAESIDAVVGLYQQTQYEKAVGRNDTSARQALYFARVAPKATESIYQVLNDSTLGAVVREAYGLPKETAALDARQQVRQLEAKGFDYTKLSDPKYVETLINRFLASKDASGAPTGADEDVAINGTASAASAVLTSMASQAAESNGIMAIDLSFLAAGGRFNILA